MYNVNENKAFVVFSFDTERIKRVLIFILLHPCHSLILGLEMLVDKTRQLSMRSYTVRTKVFGSGWKEIVIFLDKKQSSLHEMRN